MLGNAHSNASAEIADIAGDWPTTVCVRVPVIPPACRSCACPARTRRRPSEARTRTEIGALTAGTLVIHCASTNAPLCPRRMEPHPDALQVAGCIWDAPTIVGAPPVMVHVWVDWSE
jgi:hypothetical protein